MSLFAPVSIVLFYLRDFLLNGYRKLNFILCNLFSYEAEKKIRQILLARNVVCEGKGINPSICFPQEEQSKSPEHPTELKVKIHDKSFFPLVASSLSLGLSESYMDKLWDVDDVEELLYRYFSSKNKGAVTNKTLEKLVSKIQFDMINLQSSSAMRYKKVADIHYDLGNDLYESFLDPWMQYTCGYWARADNLNDAQLHKMELIAQKLKLKPGMKVLDIGCGWGLLCKYLAENYGVQCVGVSIGKEGIKYGQEKCKELPVDLRLMDYRDVNETFDRIVSVGMFEHVGVQNYTTYFEVASKCLKDDGIFLLHTIGVNHSGNYCTDPFVDKYIFPNSTLPRHTHITEYTQGLFVIEDWHNFSHDYHKTLRVWKDNFVRNWPNISIKYGDKFFRMWTYYLSSGSALFRSRKLQLWQVVLSKGGLPGGYLSVR